MKKHYKLALIFGVLAFAIAACNRDDDGANAPDLLEPADGAVISETPTFVWSSVPLIEDYRIVIDSGSYTPPFKLSGISFDDPIIEKDLYDTFYTMSGADFDNLEEGAYYWKVASLKYPSDGSAPDVNWSEVRSFAIEKPEPSGLDTTYFPFGKDYEWRYEVEYWEADYRSETRDSSYDTISVLVTDSMSTSSGWIFVLDGGFYDIGHDTVEIKDGKILVFEDCVGEDANVSLIPDTSEESYHVSIRYSADTLRMENYFQWSEPGMNTMEYDDWETTRIIGIGVIKQGHIYYLFKDMGTINFARGASYRLLSFRKGGKVVWRR